MKKTQIFKVLLTKQYEGKKVKLTGRVLAETSNREVTGVVTSVWVEMERLYVILDGDNNHPFITEDIEILGTEFPVYGYRNFSKEKVIGVSIYSKPDKFGEGHDWAFIAQTTNKEYSVAKKGELTVGDVVYVNDFGWCELLCIYFP